MWDKVSYAAFQVKVSHLRRIVPAEFQVKVKLITCKGT